MRLRTIDKADVRNKKVLVRVDFNVFIEDGKIMDDFRIRRVIPTLKYLTKQRAKVIIAAHFGRPVDEKTGAIDKESFSMKDIAKRLAKDVGQKVIFVSDCIGEKAQRASIKLKSGEILMLENLRFHPEEEKNDEVFASRLASLADIYVNEAFSVSHRAHASVSAITRFLPSYAGFVFNEEVKTLHRVYDKPKHPLVMVMGGAKVETKIKLIQRFFDKADDILLGGLIANYVLKAKGIAIGKSRIDDKMTRKLKDLNWTSTKLHLPVDVVVAKEISNNAWLKTVAVGTVNDDEFILDIGSDTGELFASIAGAAKTIIWNGPLGFSELPNFAAGTENFAKAIARDKAFRVVGGGESIAALDQLGLYDKIDFVSTGGGAMLEFLAGEPMPGVEALLNKKSIKFLKFIK